MDAPDLDAMDLTELHRLALDLGLGETVISCPAPWLEQEMRVHIRQALERETDGDTKGSDPE